MTYIRDEYIRDTHNGPNPPRWLMLAMIRVWIAILCRCRGVREEDFYAFIRERCHKHLNREGRRVAKRNVFKPSGYPVTLKPLIPRALGADLSPNQIRERCSRLSTLSRSCLYDMYHYRREYRRIGALRIRAKAPITKTVTVLSSCGLSDAHVWPD